MPGTHRRKKLIVSLGAYQPDDRVAVDGEAPGASLHQIEKRTRSFKVQPSASAISTPARFIEIIRQSCQKEKFLKQGIPV